MAIIASKNYPTQHYAIKDGPLSKYGLDIDTPQKVPGDGSVPWTAAVGKKDGVDPNPVLIFICLDRSLASKSQSSS